MQPLAIIESFNKRENLSSGLAVSLIRLVMNQFILQRTEEAFGHGVVIAVPFPAHAWRKAEVPQALLIQPRTVLRPLIGMMNESRLNLPLTDGHRQGVERELLVRLVSHGPTNHPP